ncbi:MAG: N-acetyl-gamma-glutamyl-phosphate reductase [Acidimicrobiia bacterium]
MKTAAIFGASGYAGGELIRFLDEHPSFELVYLGAHSKAGAKLSEVHPHLQHGHRVLEPLDTASVRGVDVVFLALPHGASAAPAMQLLDGGSNVVDLGSDFRLDTGERYVEAYGSPHPVAEQLGQWAYGLPELFGEEIAQSDRIAVPGCYPTSAVLGLAPLVANGLVRSEGIVIDSLSGISGAGRGGGDALSFGAIDESVKAYKVGSHRHRPEIERALDLAGGLQTSVVFTPHLVPMQRGILSTIYADVAEGVSEIDLIECLDKAYAESRFVHRIGHPPETKWVVGSNNALMSVHLEERTRTAVVLVAIDNLVKGAAGQAVQCANLMLSLDEAAGLPATGWMP